MLRNFVDADGRIRELPAREAKRQLVLEYVATRFEPGREYAEKRVNEILLEFHDDHVTLRRLPRGRGPAHPSSRRLPARVLRDVDGAGPKAGPSPCAYGEVIAGQVAPVQLIRP